MRVGLLIDLVNEGIGAILHRAVRSVLTALGIAVGVLSLTAMIGLTASAGASISEEFDVLKATRVEITGPSALDEYATMIDEAALRRVGGLNGVLAAGARLTSVDGAPGVSLLRPSGNAGIGSHSTPALPLSVVGVHGDTLAAEGALVVAGRSFDVGHMSRGDAVVLLGRIAAVQLGLRNVNGETLIYLDGRPFLVLGIVDSPDVASSVPLSVIMPLATARSTGIAAAFGSPTVVIRTRPGAADRVGQEAPIALDPAQPEQLSAAVPPSPKTLEGAVERATKLQLLALAAVSIVVGAMGVSNTTLVGVMERRHEIGVRRSVGATTLAIVAQFLIESALLGLLGGVVGMLLGFAVTLGVAAASGWTAVAPLWLLGLGPVLGLLVGLTAGAYPAARAARIEPVAALA